MERETDERDALIHVAFDNLARKIGATFGLSWRETLERMVAFAENDEQAPCFTTAAGKPRRRPRKLHAEAHAA